ncbi:hypothetical protein H0H93_007954 [Arthromyces matolae]|nr:hypothetical protein H0H93_007954 [Arthromyces matolae]
MNKATTLPVAPPENSQNPDAEKAYNVVKSFEAQDHPDSQVQRRRLVLLRILGYLIIYTSSHNICDEIASGIAFCGGDEQRLMDLGEFYYHNFIFSFSKFRSRTPYQSRHISRPSYVNIQEMIEKTLVQAPESHIDAKINALSRDAYRCPVTGFFDAAVTDVANWEDLVGENVIIHSQCAHIIPEGIADNKESMSPFWSILQSFGYDNITDELDNGQIHRLENVITLDGDVRDKFDRLEVWFEATE